MKLERILVAIDFSNHSLAALELAAAQARSGQASLTLLHVYETPGGMANVVPQRESPAAPEGRQQVEMEKLEEVRRASSFLEGLKVTLDVDVGLPALTIVEYARQHHFDAIFMGTHGRTGLAHLLMGNSAEEVVRRAHCAVITVHLPVQR
jgi:nucleotide-binding universal stress UspA family protein